MTRIRTHYLIDHMDGFPAANKLECACGVEIHPACDVSSASIVDAFETHLSAMPVEELDPWQREIINTEDT